MPLHICVAILETKGHMRINLIYESTFLLDLGVNIFDNAAAAVHCRTGNIFVAAPRVPYHKAFLCPYLLSQFIMAQCL